MSDRTVPSFILLFYHAGAACVERVTWQPSTKDFSRVSLPYTVVADARCRWPTNRIL